MRYVVILILILLSPDDRSGARADTPPRSRYAGICARRCGSNSSSNLRATLVDPLRNSRSEENIYIYSANNPGVVCRCHTRPIRDRNRAERRATKRLAEDCTLNCRQNIRMFDVAVVERDGSEHAERISILQYESPVGCLCTGIPTDEPAPVLPRRHPDR